MASSNYFTFTNMAIIVILLLVAYFVYNDGQIPIINDGTLEQTGDLIQEESGDVVLPTNIEQKYLDPTTYAPPETDYLKRKFDSKNKAHCGYKPSNYRDAVRGNLEPSDWDAYFNENNNIIGQSQTGDNDKFLPMDESNNNLAQFVLDKTAAPCGTNQKCDPEDLFDVDKYLPQEVNDDWFEIQPEPVSIKNRHLINITKPIGINTIGTSKKNASYDLRGAPSCPKSVVSPFLNSSIEPDTNMKPLF
jgi:hypothetical protein